MHVRIILEDRHHRLHGIEQAKRTGRPYVSVFCGVNGVGKSTSLAKITNFLMAHGHKVAIVACDTYGSLWSRWPTAPSRVPLLFGFHDVFLYVLNGHM